MRIVHVVPSYLPATRYGGPIYAVHGLCVALARAGHDVRVFTTNIDGAYDSDVPLETPVELDGVQVVYYRTRHLRRIAWAPRMLLGLAQAIEPTAVVHVHSMFGFPTVAAARCAEFKRAPYVLSPHGALVSKFIREKSYLAKTLWIRAFDARVVAHAARIHVASDAERRELCALGLRVPTMFLAPNGVDLPSQEDTQHGSARVDELAARGPYAVFLGRICWVKGLDRALRALAHTSVRLVIAGNDNEGLQPKLVQLATSLGIADRVTFIGGVAGADKWALLRSARFLLLPSYTENFGIVVAEAMAMGCPVLVTPQVGAADVVLRSESGLVVDGEPAMFGAAMQRLWTDPALCNKLGSAGANWASQHLGWDGIAGAMLRCYREVLAESSAASRPF